MRIGRLAAALAVAVAVAGAAFAQEKKEKTMAGGLVAVGAEAPDFRLNDQEGRAVRLSDLRGKKWAVLAFFPKAMTGG
jgi:cytochrome oxidase Cu insertion factor (SCO1/SenC/PrrC family)